MHWKDFRILIFFIIAAIIFGVVGGIILPSSALWFVPVISLILISIGLGVNATLFANRIEKKIDELKETLKNIGQIQEAIQKEQEKQAGPHSTIVPTLQAFTQLYMDSISGQQSNDTIKEDIEET